MSAAVCLRPFATCTASSTTHTATSQLLSRDDVEDVEDLVYGRVRCRRGHRRSVVDVTRSLEDKAPAAGLLPSPAQVGVISPRLPRRVAACEHFLARAFAKLCLWPALHAWRTLLGRWSASALVAHGVCPSSRKPRVQAAPGRRRCCLEALAWEAGALAVAPQSPPSSGTTLPGVARSYILDRACLQRNERQRCMAIANFLFRQLRLAVLARSFGWWRSSTQASRFQAELRSNRCNAIKASVALCAQPKCWSWPARCFEAWRGAAAVSLTKRCHVDAPCFHGSGAALPRAEPRAPGARASTTLRPLRRPGEPRTFTPLEHRKRAPAAEGPLFLLRHERLTCLAQSFVLWRCSMLLSILGTVTALAGGAAATVPCGAVAPGWHAESGGRNVEEPRQQSTQDHRRSCALCTRRTSSIVGDLGCLALSAWRWQARVATLGREMVAEAVVADSFGVYGCVFLSWSLTVMRRRRHECLDRLASSMGWSEAALQASVAIRAWAALCRSSLVHTPVAPSAPASRDGVCARRSSCVVGPRFGSSSAQRAPLAQTALTGHRGDPPGCLPCQMAEIPAIGDTPGKAQAGIRVTDHGHDLASGPNVGVGAML